MNKELFGVFIRDLGEWNLELTDRQLEQFALYYDMMIETNKVMNLTAITDFEEVLKKHFLDSLSISRETKLADSPYSIIDIGTGAGFPGIPLKIMFPNLKITLLDSLNKRVGFLTRVIEELDLENIEALHGRAEDFAKVKDYREQYDYCVSRAVANLSSLSELCLPFVKLGGYFVPYKSEKSGEEIPAAENALKILGGKIRKIDSFQLPKSDLQRDLIYIEKVKATPGKYPRKAGTPAKEPL